MSNLIQNIALILEIKIVGLIVGGIKREYMGVNKKDGAIIGIVISGRVTPNRNAIQRKSIENYNKKRSGNIRNR